ncbi:multidrug effflux MFS transporter [Brevundimonas mediterranea]|uniref:Bcr/CflA family efflux transporter n=1 Tax=Brevundimonas mediterranea TaxID=74329 RepID=A0A7W6A5E3_9CAUL|nr:multidrug effflux MFS transporter [Brevundimonas mediterranea]MBB3872507.1 DHA1 family bicyclomycin/chloramphenicol resistance-like MFS transporter [Brevundimonas mediterranea]
MSSSPASAPAKKELGFVEFVCLIALMMALNALAIDSMLPALPHIGADLNVATDNDRQWVVTAYLLGFGGAQLFYGPLADRFGRKPVLLFGVGVYVVFSLLATLAPSFDMLILARIGQGLGSACTRVLAVSIVRDRYEGRTMARVMSFSFLVFLGVPILAPSLGQLIMLVGPWRWIFAGLGLIGVALIVWATLRLPETLKPEDRLPIQFKRLTAAYKIALTDRTAVGYTLAMTAITGALFGFVNSSQQIFADVFHAEAAFPAIFALIAGGIAVASIVNARLVVKLGSRKISHTALIGFTGISAIHALVALSGHETIWTFAILQTLTMFCFGLIAGNFGAMAMETMGHIAGTAASIQGFISTIFGSLLGFAVGQQFNGTTVPMVLGFTVFGLIALAWVLFAERGRLFRSHHAPGATAH